MTRLSAFALAVFLAIARSSIAATASPSESNLIDRASSGRDPFAPITSDQSERRTIHPLERFAVRELRLVATVDGIVPPRALIEDPNGLGFIVTLGSIVGAERGKVVSIEAGKVVLNASLDVGGRHQIVILGGQASKQEQP